MRLGVKLTTKLNTKRRGISELMSNLILVIIVVGGMMATITLATDYFHNILDQAKPEKLAIEDVTFSSTNIITVTVRNIGKTDSKIVTVLVNDEDMSSYMSPSTLTLQPSHKGHIYATCSWASGETYTIVVMSERGATTYGSYTAS